MIRLAGLLMAAVFAGAAIAAEAPPAADDPALEKRVVQLTSELRCLVCQNQSLADSHADLAIDLRNQIREMMRAGKSDAEIRDYMVQRYGDFVLYRPPLKATTVLLWAGPFALLLAGFVGLVAYLRRRRARAEGPELSAEERARAQALLGGNGGHGS
ncbi:MAG TPA: cytochrome c-type biogenesis protein [Burkholderiales bacterium]|nr:cytochrome c-type biogenesis protein [Burkholderiales bacterium]